MEFKTVLREVGRWFDGQGYPYAVVGGLALHAYGISRLTYDLDLITMAEAQETVVPFLEALGYETLYLSQGFSNHQHTKSDKGRIDLIYVRNDTATQIFEAAESRVLLEDLEVKVPRPEHLIALKLHAMQNEPDRAPQDLADIRQLMVLPDTDREAVQRAFQKRGEEDLYERLQETCR